MSTEDNGVAAATPNNRYNLMGVIYHALQGGRSYGENAEREGKWEEEIRQRVKEILLKRDLGNDLTSQEEMILAYTHYAAGEEAVRIKVGPDTETGE